MNETRVGGRLVQALFTCLAAVSTVPVALAAEEPVGKVASIQNQVETRPAGASDWTASTLHQ